MKASFPASADADRAPLPSSNRRRACFSVTDTPHVNALHGSAETVPARRPLLPAQHGVWVAQQLDASNPRYNCGGYLEIHGAVDVALFERAVRGAISETDALRVRFIDDGQGPWQIVGEVPEAVLSVLDLRAERDPLQAAEAWMRADLTTPVDLSAPPLYAHALFRLADDRYAFYLRYHHIVMDGFAQTLYWRRVGEIYSALARGAAPAPSPFGSLDAVLAETAAYDGSPALARDRDYWLGAFADRPEPARLAGPASLASRGLLRRTADVEPATSDALREAARRAGTRWSVIALAATAAYLRRLTGSDDVVLALPVSARSTPLARATPCMLANELPLRLHVRASTTLAELERQVSEQVGRVLKHQRYRGEELQRELRLAGAEQRVAGPVVNVITFDRPVRFGEHRTTAHHLSSGPVTDLLIGFYGRSDGSELQLYFDADPELYGPDDVAGHQRRFAHFLAAVAAAGPQRTVAELDLLLPGEREQLERFNATARDYDLSACLHELIDAQALRTPDATAVAVAGAALTYRELVERADRLAAHLERTGVRAGDRVGVYDVRSLELVVELLAVLKAGAAYVPLDPELPAARLEFQLRDAGIAVVLTRSALADRIAALGAAAVPADTLLPALPPAAPPTARATPESAAYVIYTSGSTGRPKGVAVPHRGVVNRLLWMQEEYRLGPADCVLQKTPFTFDVSVWELFWPLLAGSRLFLAEPGGHRDPRYLARTIREQAITTLHFVPPMLDLFLTEPQAAAPSALRQVMCSGEALRPQTVGRFFERFARRVELHNLYGPTEASIDVTFHRCTPADAAGPVPIGRPVANTGIYLLDDQREPLPVGIAGELYIGGVQVAAGYLGRPELTRERFLPDPFSGGTMYRTGDLARYRPDGTIDFLGRLDDQVKVRGFRIELGEIESALLAHPAVGAAVVTTWERSDGDRRLVAYVVAAGALVPEELPAYLAGELPDYMLPAHVVVLDALPLLPNGKLDRRALPEPDDLPATAAAVPESSAERLLYEVWREVLGTERFGIDDSFFALGGDSMLGIRARAAVEERGSTFAVQDLFGHPTVRELARQLRPHDRAERDRARSEPFGLVRAEDRARLPDGLDDAYPLSAMQAGMLFHTDLDAETAVYRVVTSLHVAAPFDEAALRAALADTFRRHPALRSSFDLSTYSEPLQLVHRAVDVPLEVGEDIGGLDDDAALNFVNGWIARAKYRRFDPAAAPLLAFTVHPRGAGAFQLSVVEHHVVLDGWSDAAMLEEIVTRYRAHRSGEELWLPAIPSTYRDFVAAERRALGDESARAFWTGLLHGAEPAPLPRAAARRADRQPTTHRAFDVPIAPDVAEALRGLARREGLPLKSLLATAHVAVLRLVCNADDVLTGSVSNGRLEEAGGDAVIGVFLNTLPLRVDTRGASLLATARRIFAHEQEAAPHRRYPFAQMQRDLAGRLQLDSYCNFMDFHQSWQAGGPGGSLIAGGTGVAETNFPLAANFLVDPATGRLRLWLDCDVSVLDPELCARLSGYYARALAAVAATPDTELAALDLLDPRELALLAGWNATALPYDRGATICGLIAEQARRTPGATALAHRWSELSYAELDARANRLAQHLRALGIGRDSLVGVSLRRGPELVVALLAVLKTGAAYVPLDPGFPPSRLEFIAADAGIHALVTERGGASALAVERVVLVDRDAAAIAAQPALPPADGARAGDPAYVIYTSGSTGLPKGTVVRHRNVVNFFAGMDERIGCGAEDVLLAVTSVSFDISVLELLWPLTHGAKVVVAGERPIDNLVRDPELPAAPLGFSMFFFAAAGADGERGDGYRLVLDAARFADAHGFEAVWTPERHFHEFGGLYPNPSVMAAALATITERVALRSGSVVAPLHDTLRIAEEWSLVDNLSHGRVGLAFASGWNANDFVLAPAAFAQRKAHMAEQLAEFRRLWHGEPVRRRNGAGDEAEVRIFPRPLQAEPPIWLTSAGAVATFEHAGTAGANVLTHLLAQDLDELAAKIAAYRRARAAAGHAGPGRVTVMAHTFVLDDAEEAKRRARGPFREYLRTSTELWRLLFASLNVEFPEAMTEEDLESVLDLAVDRYFERSGLFGSPATAAAIVRRLAAIGADEIACLIDFGVPAGEVLDSLAALDRLKAAHQNEVAEAEHALADLCRRHGVTLLQGTPSLLAAVAAEPEALAALRGARAVLVGGEAFPAGLAERLAAALPGVRVFNMYGPTETTIWSTVHELDPARDPASGTVPIGRPVANTEILILDPHGRPLPVGVAGELWIGGDGVAGPYLGRPELSAERFPAHPAGSGRVYRTGDRARWRADGRLEFLGRIDRQVKILGHRVEPDEVESVLSRHPAVGSVAVVAQTKENGSAELVAFVSTGNELVDRLAEDVHVERWGEVWDDAYADPASGARADGAERDFAGWVSSYTGEPIPVGDMREWLHHTVERIVALRPGSVVDVGVGVGLFLRALAPRTRRYLGIDVSETALRNAAAAFGQPLPAHVALVHGDAGRLAGLEPRSAEVVVLNSVVQYFPGTGYLERVLGEAARVVGPRGAVFVGDVRDLELLEAFHATVQLHRAPALMPAGEIAAAVARQVAAERELCLAPAFFRGVAATLATVGQIRLELKRGHAENELTCFRYDVTLLGRERPEPDGGGETVAWNGLPAGRDRLDTLAELLAGSGSGALTVTGIPNRRLVRPLRLVRLLREADPATTAWELERRLWDADDPAAADPEAVAALADRLGRGVQLVPHHGRLDAFDAAFAAPESDR